MRRVLSAIKCVAFLLAILLVVYLVFQGLHIARAEQFRNDYPSRVITSAEMATTDYLKKELNHEGDDSEIQALSKPTGTEMASSPMYRWQTSGEYDEESFSGSFDLLRFSEPLVNEGSQWYIAHSFSPYGFLISQLNRGDIVEVDGVTWRVEEWFLVPRDATANGFAAALDSKHCAFQTCVSDFPGDMWIIIAQRCSTE